MVVNADGTEYVLVYRQGDLSWGYSFDRGAPKLCSDVRTFENKGGLHGVFEDVGPLQAPPPKQAKTDACGRPMPKPGPSS